MATDFYFYIYKQLEQLSGNSQNNNMMRNFFLFICLLIITTTVHAQIEFTSKLDALIEQGMLSTAEGKVDSVLMINPGNVDALFYKGNIQYYKYASFADALSSTGAPDESVYTSDYTYIGQYKEIVPIKIADTCAFYFKNALRMDRKRDDILLALGYLYSVSLQGNKLNEILPAIAKVPTIDEFNIRDYAYNLLDRGAYQEGMKVYEKIGELYPANGNLISDIAVEYYIIGDINSAIKFANKSYLMEGLDTVSYNNAFFLFSVAEQYEQAQFCINKWAALNNNKTNILYEGLLSMLAGKENAKSKIVEYVEAEKSNSPEKDFAKYLLSVDLRINPDNYDTIYNFGLTDAFSIIINHYFFTKFPEAFSPAYNYAEGLTYNKRYADALKVYAKINTAAADKNDLEEYNFYYAWALYNTGQFEVANLHWEAASTSTIPFIASGANYFLGKYYYMKGDNVNARKYFLLGANAVGKSKYSEFCSDYLSNIR